MDIVIPFNGQLKGQTFTPWRGKPSFNLKVSICFKKVPLFAVLSRCAY